MSPPLIAVVAIWSLAGALLAYQLRPTERVQAGFERWTLVGDQLRDQLLLVVLAALGAVALIWWQPQPLTWIAAALVIAAAWQIPLIVARTRENRRRARCEIELSHALGEMVMGVEAGLTLEMVMSQYAQRHHSDLSAEFTHVLDQIALGASRTEALDEMRERTPTPEIQSFVTAVHHNQKIGTPLAEIMRQQARTARRRRRQAVEEHAATLSLKMIFPTVFCILPVLLVVIVGPAIVRLILALPA
jgi:tight adherence protein C